MLLAHLQTFASL